MITVKVPATSANMGPGFDSLGIALERYNKFSFKEIEKGLIFKGIPNEFCNEENIIYKAMNLCFSKNNYNPKGLEIVVNEQNIPISRGLGSSSSCIVGGLLGANEIMGNPFNKNEILKMAVEMEGHPDNVAPAILGGMVVSIMDEGQPFYDIVNLKDDLEFVVIIPNFKLETKEARGVLPVNISLKDGVYNASRTALIVASLCSGNYDLLKYACKDSFHESYRGKLIRGFNEIKGAALEMGALAVFLSGAGPSIMAIINKSDMSFSNKINGFLKDNNFDYEVSQLKVDINGAITVEGETNEK
ncbi:MAG: homoserine kinase [Clostridium sp.]